VVDTLQDPALQAELDAVYRLYAALARKSDPETGLGGKLLYAGELDLDGFRLVRAANIAGAASLSATADSDRQKRAVREGVVDFLVTSLDEALRILKNEIRKRRGVAVGVALAPGPVEQEMFERGVLPDLLFPGADFGEWAKRGAETVERSQGSPEKTLVTVALPSSMRQLVSDFESLLLGGLAEDDFAARRWFSISPRYLGPQARQYRSLPCDADMASTLLERFSHAIEDWSRSRERS
jgi:Urocanase Rossmann-like domain